MRYCVAPEKGRLKQRTQLQALPCLFFSELTKITTSPGPLRRLPRTSVTLVVMAPPLLAHFSCQ